MRPFNKIFFLLLTLSIIIIVLLIIVNVIFLSRSIYTPRIFFPGIILFFANFLSAGGVIGSYAPIHANELVLIQTRKCTSIAMLIISLVIIPIFLMQNFSFYYSLKDAKNFCELNNGKSKENFYSEIIKEKEGNQTLKTKYIYNYNNGLTCLENKKCIKSRNVADLYICNYNFEQICNKIFETDYLMNEDDDLNIPFFVSSCLNIKKQNIKPNVDLYKCNTGINLAKDAPLSNEEKEQIQKYHNNNIKIINDNIKNLDEKLDNFDGAIYTYEEKCYNNSTFNFYLISTILYILLTSFISISWIIIGFFTILKSYRCIEDVEMKNYKERMKKINEDYNKMNSQKNNPNDNDETTPINIQ